MTKLDLLDYRRKYHKENDIYYSFIWKVFFNNKHILFEAYSNEDSENTVYEYKIELK